MKQTVPLTLITLLLSSCASLENSLILGSGIGATAGGVTGLAISHKAGGTLIGGGIGALVGAGISYLFFKDQRDKQNARAAAATANDKNQKDVPSLTAPDVRRVWIDDKVEGNRFIKGHYEFVLDRGSVWAK